MTELFGLGQVWSLIRFRLISDTGEIVNIDPREGFDSSSAEITLGEDLKLVDSRPPAAARLV